MRKCAQRQWLITPMVSYANQRASRRALVLCPIYLETPGGRVHGIVRDISVGGIFFYSNFRPLPDSFIDFHLTLNSKRISARGRVLRIEQNAPGAAIGIALKIENGATPGQIEPVAGI